MGTASTVLKSGSDEEDNPDGSAAAEPPHLKEIMKGATGTEGFPGSDPGSPMPFPKAR
jgi:hypothetical protein